MLVGRVAELERLDCLVTAALGGCGTRLFVVGDPGIGKSALLESSARRATRRGVQVVRVHAVNGEWELPYSLLSDLFRVTKTTPPPVFDEARIRSQTTLELLISLTIPGPVLLLIDDAQFADTQSLAALAIAAERSEDLPLTVVVASRLDPQVELRFTSWPRLDLQPLVDDAAVAILRAALGPDQPSAVIRELALVLHGNPLALLETPDLLSSDQLAGKAALPDPMPTAPSLSRSWADTLDRLPEPTTSALLGLAVTMSRPDLLTALSYSSDDLDSAAAAGIVSFDPELGPRFVNPLVGQIVEARAPTAVSRQLHHQVADAAQRLELPPDVVVHHLVQSVATPDTGTSRAVANQAERAERLTQFDVAARAWEFAAQLSTTAPDRVSRALRAIRLHFLYGPNATNELLDLVAGYPLNAESSSWVERLRAGQRGDADPAVTLTALWAGVEHARQSTPDLLPLLLWDVAATAGSCGSIADGLRAAQEYLDLERHGGHLTDTAEPPWTGTALLASALFQAGDIAASMPLRAQAIRAASNVDPTRIDIDQLLTTVQLDDLLLDVSPAATERVLVAGQRLGDVGGSAACLYGIQAWRARARGDLASARSLLERGLPLAQAAGGPEAGLGMAALEVELAGIAGDDDTLLEAGNRLRAVATGCADRRRLATLDRALGLRELAAGRPEAAITSLCAAADVAFLGRGLRDAVLPSRVDLVEAFARTGDPLEASRRQSQLHPLLRAMDDPLAAALDARAFALVSTGAEAEWSYRAALDAHTRALDPFEQARTQLLYGEYLRRERRHSAARAPLRSAARTFEQLAAAPWLARAHDELRAAGGRGGVSAGPTTLTTLTAQESTVAREVASGRTNREVAEALYLSPRTVEYHLGNVYRKLGVHGRSALARRILDDESNKLVASRMPDW